MSQRINKNIVVAFSVICFLFLFITLFSVYNNRRFLSISKELQGTNMLMKSLSDISADSHDASLIAEHYFITREKDFLDDLNVSKKELSDAINSTVEYSGNHLSFQKDLSALSLSTKDLLNYLTKYITGQKKQEDKMDLDVLDALHEKINSQVVVVEKLGRAHLRTLENDQQQFIIRANLFNYLVALLSIALLFVLFLFIQQLFNKRKKAERNLISFNDALEKKVNEKTTELKHTFDRITDAFIALDTNWCYTYVNKKAAELHQRTPESLLGKNIWEEFPDVINEPFYEALHRAMQLQKPENVQLYYSKDDKWFEDFIYPSFNGLSVYYQDITEKKKAEEKLRLSELRYRSLIEQASDGIFIASAEGFYIEVNTAACEMLGYSREELLKMSSKDILYSREGLENLPSRYEAMMLGEKIISENTLKRKDGTAFYSEANMQMLPDGRFIGIVRDISERKKQENVIKQASRNMKMILDNTEEAFIVLDKNLNVITFNKTAERNSIRLLGIPVTVGLSILAMAKTGREEQLKKMYADVLCGYTATYNYEVAREGDTRFIFKFKYSPVRNESDEVIAIMINVRNITKENELEEKLKESEEQFRGAFEYSAIGMVLISNEGKWKEVNERLCDITGYSKMELYNFTSREITHAEDYVVEQIYLQELIDDKRSSYHMEKRYLHKNGNMVWVLIAVSKVLDIDGNIKHFICQVEDISEKVKAEEQKEFERRDKEALINTTNDLIWSVSKDIRLIAANKSFIKNIETATGITLNAGDELLIEKSFSEDFIKLWRGLYNRALSGESFIHELYTPIPENVEVSWSEISFNPILNTEEIIGVACYARNITEAKQYQSRILDMNQRLETAQEIAKLGYWEINIETQEVYWSKQVYSIWETSPENFKPTYDTLIASIHNADLHSFQSAYENALANQSGLDVILKVHVADGKQKYLNCKGTFIKKENGETKLSGTVQDISDLKEAEEALNESERKYRLLFHNNPTPMFMLAVPTFNIIDVNDSAVKHYGYTRQKFLSMNARDLRPKEEVKRYEQFAINKEIQGTRNAGKWKHKTSNGTVIDVEIITHDFNYKNQLSRIVLANDITKRLQAENELKNSHEQLRQLSSYLQTVREKERTRIAREIHDELGQQLTGLRMDATWINKKITGDQKLTNKITGMIGLIDETVKSVRRISAELRPGILDDLGLTAALEWQTQEFEKRTGITCRFKSFIKEPVFDKDISTGIFRVYQETLTNVARHADATEVETILERINGEIILEIKDNGRGFEVEEIKKKSTLGLIGMRERANMFGGELQLDSKPGRGTAVTLRIPIFIPEKTEA